MRNIYLITKCSALLLISTASVMAQPKKSVLDEQHRPQIHFSPAAHWINDPNGMVYSNGIYHLFYQYHPYSSVWGPMHWGHASSSDMVHWKELPIAIYPDSIGTIFSGSAVVDINNTSGFGKKGTAPLVAIFTQHNMEAEKAGKNDFQNQSIAYSVDGGNTWTKYAANPVLTNPGIKDFRDPKPKARNVFSFHRPKLFWNTELSGVPALRQVGLPDCQDTTINNLENSLNKGGQKHKCNLLQRTNKNNITFYKKLHLYYYAKAYPE